MRHPLHFDRSYRTEMLRNKAQPKPERVMDLGRHAGTVLRRRRRVDRACDELMITTADKSPP